MSVFLAVLLGPPHPAHAAATSIGLAADPAYAGSPTVLTVRVVDDGAPVAGVTVTLERQVGGTWQPLDIVTTDASGTATRPVELSRRPADNRVRATYDGQGGHEPATAEIGLQLRKREGRVVIDGPAGFVDGRAALLRVRWTTPGGEPVQGPVQLQRRDAGRWRTEAMLQTDADGWADRTVSPRTDTSWRAVARDLPWVTGDVSPVHALDNRPPGEPVRLPRAAPRPRRHLSSPPAVGEGPHPWIGRIPDGVWRQMTGRTWHPGCPVGRDRLRLLRINFWDFRGYRRRGELVAAASVVRQMAGALAAMHRARLPIRAMHRVDRFGWSDRLRGGDDYASMAAGNTSAFNCRDVVGRPGVRSPHSYGRSLDLNPWENPYHSSHGWTPNAWWAGRSHPRVAWRSRGHRVVQIMSRHGLRWTYGTHDSQHFDAVPRGGRLLRVPACGVTVCH